MRMTLEVWWWPPHNFSESIAPVMVLTLRRNRSTPDKALNGSILIMVYIGGRLRRRWQRWTYILREWDI